MMLGCFSIPNEIPYDSDYRSEYQRLRDIPELAFVTGGHCYEGVASASRSEQKTIQCKNRDILYYAKNVFWIEGYSMEPVPEGGFRRYPVDYTIRLSLTEARRHLTGTPPKIRIVLQDIVDVKKKTHHFRLCANNGGVWGWAWNDTEELPWTPEADVFDAIAKCGWKSNWVVSPFTKWDERKGRFAEFKKSFVQTIKKAHPDGAFDVRSDGETLISTWLFKRKDGALTDILCL